MEGSSLTGHAASHDIYKYNLHPEDRQRREQGKFPCSLPAEKCFELAVEEEIWYVTKLHLEQAPQKVNTPTESGGVTALMNFGHKADYAQYLLNLGADVDAQNRQGDSVLMHLVKQKNVEPEAVKILIDAGANVHVRDKHGIHVILYAARKYSLQIVEMLLAAGVRVRDLGTEAHKVLVRVVQNEDQNADFVKMLIDGGADVNSRDENGLSVLMLACCKSQHAFNLELVKLLVHLRADVNYQEKYKKRSPLLLVCESQNEVNINLVELLLQAGADVNARGKNNRTALMIICNKQHGAMNVELIKLLLESGAIVNAQDQNKRSALMLVCQSQHNFNLEITKLLVDAGANVNAEDKNKRSALLLAFASQHKFNLEISKLLVDAGANVNAQDKSKRSALMLVCQSQHKFKLKIVKLLLEAGADFNHKNTEGKSALMFAQEDTLVKMLVEAGADVHAKNKDGNSVLMLNIMHNTQINLQLVKIITEAGANLLEENNKKETVLTIAIRLFKKCNNKEQMLLIIKHFLEHPQVNQNVISICDGKNHPKKVLLSIFDTHYNNSDFVKLFKIIIHSQFKDESYLENVQLQNHHNLIDQTNNVSLGSIALLVNNYRPINYIRIENNRALQPYIQDLLDAGFDMQAGGLSPLTVFILKIKSGYIFNVVITGDQPEEGDEPWPHPTSNFIDFLIANGAHVGQQMLPLGCIDATLQVVREQLYLPDALLAALYTRNMQAVRQLLPFWGFPGLYLLLFTPRDWFISETSRNKILRLFLVLLEHGGVPHGTEVYVKLTRCLEACDPLCRDVFYRIQSSPLSLRELCRCEVRASLAAQVSIEGHMNLPALLLPLSPPGLKDFLLMQPGNLGLLVCDDPLLVQAAREPYEVEHEGYNDEMYASYKDEHFGVYKYIEEIYVSSEDEYFDEDD